MANLQKYSDHYITFVEAGFIAVNQMDEDSAIKLFRAAEMLQPQNFLPKVGIGYLHLCKLELRQACKCFEEVLARDPYNEMAKTFLGLSMALIPSDSMKGEKILSEETVKGKDSALKHLAKDAIDFVEKFVKKSPTPAQLQGGKKATKKKK